MPDRLIPSPDYAAGLGEVKSRNLRNMKCLFSACANTIIQQQAVASALGITCKAWRNSKEKVVKT